MANLTKSLSLLVLSVGLFRGPTFAVSITIDHSREYQTIEGLGCYYHGITEARMPRVLDDLGAVAIRFKWGYDEVRNDPTAKKEKAELVDLAVKLKAVGPKIRKAFPKVKIVGPDEVTGKAYNYFRYLRDRDPEALKYLDALSIHGYIDNVNPNPEATGSQLWASFGNMAISQGKNLWMTEISGFQDTWIGTEGGGAFGLGKAMFSGLKHGRLSWWTWWKYEGVGGQIGDVASLTIDSRTRWPYYISKLYFRWIRPGAVQIGCIGDTTAEVYGLAFRHKEKRTLTVVLLNNSSSNKSVTLEGTQLPGTFERHLCDASNKCTSKGTVSSGTRVSLPRQSFTLLYGADYDPPVAATAVEAPVRPRPSPNISAPQNAVRMFRLDGSMVAPSATPARSGSLTPAVIELRRAKGRHITRRMTLR